MMVDKDGQPVRSDLVIAPNSTATEGVLYHSPQDDPPADTSTNIMDSGSKGPPRLLVKDLSEVVGDKSTPAMEVKISKMGDEPDAIHRAFVYKNHVVDPKFIVLLYPYLLGEPSPTVSWSPDHKSLLIGLPGKKTDVITLDRSNPDHRTRIVGTVRQQRAF
jgi:hypothetical protein